MTRTEMKPPTIDQSEARRAWLLSGAHARAVRQWWQRLTWPDEALKSRGLPPGWPSGVRAQLRRCDSPEAAMLTEGFRKLWSMLGDDNADVYGWAGVAMVLSEVRAEQVGVTLATELGKRKGETSKPRMSELRFQQLMECSSFDELVQRLRRALALVDKRGVSVVHLAADILQWLAENQQHRQAAKPTQRLSFLWANDYFRQVAGYRTHEDT